MRMTRNALHGATCLFVLASLSGCANAPECKPVVRTETVTVYRDRVVTVSPSLVARVPEPAWPAVITNRVLEGHDASTTQALARANDKLDVLRCAGVAGVDGTMLAPCPTLPKPASGE